MRRRPRRGSVDRPVNGRLYRGTWLLVGLPLLVLAFSVARPPVLQPPNLPPAFDRTDARTLAAQLADGFPSRIPGTPAADAAARWFARELSPYGYTVRRETFTATVAGHGRIGLVNLVAEKRGLSHKTIVVLAHRDDAGTGPGANDNASGTAALIELARAYAPTGGAAQLRLPYSLLFLSTDGGVYGGLGAAEFAARSPERQDVIAVIDLDAIAGSGRARLELAGDTPRSPAAGLVETVRAQLAAETGADPGRPSALRQLVDLGFPYSAYEQAPFVARGIPAVTITTSPDRPPTGIGDAPERPRRSAARADRARDAERRRRARAGDRALAGAVELRLPRQPHRAGLGDRDRPRRRAPPVPRRLDRPVRALPAPKDPRRAGAAQLSQQACLLGLVRRALRAVRRPRRLAERRSPPASADKCALADGGPLGARDPRGGRLARLPRPARAPAAADGRGDARGPRGRAPRARGRRHARRRDEPVRARVPPAVTPSLALAATGPGARDRLARRRAAPRLRRACAARVVVRDPLRPRARRARGTSRGSTRSATRRLPGSSSGSRGPRRRDNSSRSRPAGTRRTRSPPSVLRAGRFAKRSAGSCWHAGDTHPRSPAARCTAE